MTDPAASRPFLARFAPLLLIVVLAGAFFAAGGQRYLTLDALKSNYGTLQGFVERNFWAALGLYMLAYIGVTALSLPGATLMSLIGGFLFGNLVGTGAVVVAATIGATIIFLAARFAFSGLFRDKTQGFLARMEAGFRDNAFSYLLLLRLIPLFPFFIVNVAPAFSTIRTRTFVAATFVGIIPGAFAFVSAGNGLGAVLEQGGDIALSGLLTRPEILAPIAALSLLALAPLAYKAMRKERA